MYPRNTQELWELLFIGLYVSALRLRFDTDEMIIQIITENPWKKFNFFEQVMNLVKKASQINKPVDDNENCQFILFSF